jgi:hypothetical protein
MSQAGRVTRFLVVLLAVAARPAAAKNISITITPRVELQGDAVVAQVGVRNGGDESAQSVSVTLIFRDQQVRGQIRPELAPQQAMDASLSIPAAGLQTGHWPYRVAIDYTDANQYPFQALHAGILTVGTPPLARVAIPSVTAPALSTTGTLRVHLKNLSGVARAATVSGAGPEGIEITTPPAQLTLAPWGEVDVEHGIANRTALAGSRYPVFVTVEYEDEGVHQAVIGQGIIEIRGNQSFFETWRVAFWIGAAVFVMIWLAILVWRLSAPRRRQGETRAASRQRRGETRS